MPGRHRRFFFADPGAIGRRIGGGRAFLTTFPSPLGVGEDKEGVAGVLAGVLPGVLRTGVIGVWRGIAHDEHAPLDIHK